MYMISRKQRTVIFSCTRKNDIFSRTQTADISPVAVVHLTTWCKPLRLSLNKGDLIRMSLELSLKGDKDDPRSSLKAAYQREICM